MEAYYSILYIHAITYFNQSYSFETCSWPYEIFRITDEDEMNICGQLLWLLFDCFMM